MHMGESGKVYTAVCVLLGCGVGVGWECSGSECNLRRKNKVWETKTERYRELCVYVV